MANILGMFKGVSRWAADTVARLSLENFASWIVSMLIAAMGAWWVTSDPFHSQWSRLEIIILVFAIALFLSLLFFLTSWAMWFLRRRKALNPDDLSQPGKELGTPSGLSERKVYEGHHEILMLFVSEHLLAAYTAQCMAQNALIELLAGDTRLAKLAKGGVDNDITFYTAITHLLRLHDSPPKFIPLHEMINCVDIAEQHYAEFVRQGFALRRDAGKQLTGTTEPDYFWDHWREQHNAMIEAYEPIKKNSNFSKLFRPGRESRWGGHVSKMVPSGAY